MHEIFQKIYLLLAVSKHTWSTEDLHMPKEHIENSNLYNKWLKILLYSIILLQHEKIGTVIILNSYPFLNFQITALSKHW
jgi:hypothetical protein